MAEALAVRITFPQSLSVRVRFAPPPSALPPGTVIVGPGGASTAAKLSFDDTLTALGVDNVQDAIVALYALIGATPPVPAPVLLSGALSGSSALAGALSVTRALSGAVTGTGALTGDLTVEDAPSQRVIWDTDQDSDIDDVIATAVLQALEETGEAVLIATTLATKNNDAPDAMRKLLNFSGRTTVPVGSHQGTGTLGGPDTSFYTTGVAELLPPAKIARASYPTAVSVLTDALTASPDGSVKIIVGGTCTNIAALLASPGGVALVAAKVVSIHVMGGWFNGSTAVENNILFDVAAANTVASTSPVPVYWAGAEVGGPVLTRMSPGYSTATNPYALAWNLYAVASRPSWDTVPVLDAIRGSLPELYTHSAPGNVSFDGASVTTFTADAGGKNRFLIRADASSGGNLAFADYINALVDQFMAAHDTPALYLLGEYKMEEGTGQVLVDSSPFARNGTLGSSASVEATDPTWDANGLAFNADTAVVLNSPDFESRTFTYCYVVRPDNITGIKVISARDSSSLVSRAEQIRMNAGKLELVLRYGATAAVPVSATVNFAVGQWALVTVRVAADRRTYMGRVNGLEVISGVLPADLSPGSFQNFCLGSRVTGTAVSDGMIGVIRYAAASIALSDADVDALEARARTFASSKGITLP